MTLFKCGGRGAINQIRNFAHLPNDGLTFNDFISEQPKPSLELRTIDGRLRLPEWLKRDVKMTEKDVCFLYFLIVFFL